MAGWIEEGPRLNGQPVVLSFYRIVVRPESTKNGDSHLSPDAAGDTAPAKGRGPQRKSGRHRFHPMRAGKTHRLTTCATGDSEGLPVPRSRR